MFHRIASVSFLLASLLVVQVVAKMLRLNREENWELQSYLRHLKRDGLAEYPILQARLYAKDGMTPLKDYHKEARDIYDDKVVEWLRIKRDWPSLSFVLKEVSNDQRYKDLCETFSGDLRSQEQWLMFNYLANLSAEESRELQAPLFTKNANGKDTNQMDFVRKWYAIYVYYVLSWHENGEKIPQAMPIA